MKKYMEQLLQLSFSSIFITTTKLNMLLSTEHNSGSKFMLSVVVVVKFMHNTRFVNGWDRMQISLSIKQIKTQQKHAKTYEMPA